MGDNNKKKVGNASIYEELKKYRVKNRIEKKGGVKDVLSKDNIIDAFKYLLEKELRLKASRQETKKLITFLWDTIFFLTLKYKRVKIIGLFDSYLKEYECRKGGCEGLIEKKWVIETSSKYRKELNPDIYSKVKYRYNESTRSHLGSRGLSRVEDMKRIIDEEKNKKGDGDGDGK